MSDSKTYLVSEFATGDYMAWHVCSQAASRGTVKLKDDKQTYFTARKDNSSAALQTLTNGSGGGFFTGGDNLRIEITVDYPGASIKGTLFSHSILGDRGDVVGHSLNIAIEDLDDEDYNDYYISLVAWKKKG